VSIGGQITAADINQERKKNEADVVYFRQRTQSLEEGTQKYPELSHHGRPSAPKFEP
jgi:hypothetical protein